MWLPDAYPDTTLQLLNQLHSWQSYVCLFREPPGFGKIVLFGFFFKNINLQSEYSVALMYACRNNYIIFNKFFYKEGRESSEKILIRIVIFISVSLHASMIFPLFPWTHNLELAGS